MNDRMNGEKMVDEVEETSKDFSLYRALGLPGSLATLAIVSIVGEYFGLLSTEVSRVMLEVFSLPILFTFIIEALLNEEIDLKLYPPIFLFGSFSIFIVREGFANAYLFIPGMIISFFVIFLYYLLHHISPIIEKLIPGRQEVTKRFLLVSAFLPATLISLAVLQILINYGIEVFVC